MGLEKVTGGEGQCHHWVRACPKVLKGKNESIIFDS